MSDETNVQAPEPETSPATEPPHEKEAPEPTESDPIDAEFEDPDAKAEAEAEAEAAKLGWKKDFKPNKFYQKNLSAKDFLARHFDAEIGTRELKKLLIEQKKEIGKLKHSLNQQREFAVKSVQQIENESREEKLALIKARQRRAVEEGDVQSWEALDKQKEELQRQPSKFKAPEPEKEEPEQKEDNKGTQGNASLDHETQSFLRENPWFNSDPDLTSYAVSLEQYYQRKGYSGRALFDEVAKEVKRTRPEKFDNPNRDRAPPVNEVDEGRTARRSSGGYDSLPAEARRACEKFVAEGLADKQYKSKQEAQKEFIRLYQS